MHFQHFGVQVLQIVHISPDTHPAGHLRRGAAVPQIHLVLRVPHVPFAGLEVQEPQREGVHHQRLPGAVPDIAIAARQSRDCRAEQESQHVFVMEIPGEDQHDERRRGGNIAVIRDGSEGSSPEIEASVEIFFRTRFVIAGSVFIRWMKCLDKNYCYRNTCNCEKVCRSFNLNCEVQNLHKAALQLSHHWKL